MVLLIIHFLAEEIRRRRMSSCAAKRKDLGEVFRLDAKAEGEEVAIGGWRTRDGAKTADAPWFAVRLNRRNAPWAFARGEALAKPREALARGDERPATKPKPEAVGVEAGQRVVGRREQRRVGEHARRLVVWQHLRPELGVAHVDARVCLAARRGGAAERIRRRRERLAC